MACSHLGLACAICFTRARSIEPAKLVFVWIAVVVMTQQLLPTARADDGLLPEDRLLQGLWRGREKLHSGVVRIKQTTRRANQPREEELELLYAFDYAIGNLRFDQNRDGRRTQLIRTPTETLLHLFASGAMEIQPPEWEVPIDDARPSDMRLVGLISDAELEFHTTYQQFRDFTDRMLLTDVSPVSTGVVRLTWTFPLQETTVRRSITIDVEKDFAPIGFDLVLLADDANGNPFERIHYKGETEWEECGDIWIPKTWRLEGQSKKQHRLDFTWEIVNESVPYDYFVQEGFELPRGTWVIDQRFGEPAMKHRIGTDPITNRMPLRLK